MKFTVEEFHKHNPTHKLIGQLCGGAFDRGLPRDHELRNQPDVAKLLRTMLRGGVVKRSEGLEEDDPIRICHRNGWIHSDITPDRESVQYSFPSPLHSVWISWMLTPSNDLPNFNSIFDLSIAVISNFKPSQMQLPIWRIGARSTDRPPEAAYQDEFYRSLYSVTFGNVRFSPEFASGKGAKVAGRIDFFIPAKKWGIEITRDGNRLQEHSSRFTTHGAYGPWVTSGDMDAYILLDCRSSTPRKAHPSMVSFCWGAPNLIIC